MVPNRRPEPGDIYWIDDLPPLEGGAPTRRPVVVVEQWEDEIVVAVGVTTELLAPDRIELPNRVTEPGTTTNLPRPCAVIPRWIVRISASRFMPESYCGYLPRVTLEQVLAAVENVLSDWPGPFSE